MRMLVWLTKARYSYLECLMVFGIVDAALEERYVLALAISCIGIVGIDRLERFVEKYGAKHV